jgi:hypothetical protein
MLNFDDELVSFKLKGVEHNVVKPTNGQIKQYSKALKLCEDDESKEKALIDFLENLGLKKEVYESLTPEQLKTILSNLYDSGKN